MAYRTNIIDFEEAVSMIPEKNYALIYMISEVVFKRIQELADIDWDQCIEGRFFDSTSEIHVYREEGRLQFIAMEETDEENVICRKYELSGNFCGDGKFLSVKEYLKADQDGQMQIAYTKPAAVEV